MTRAFEKLVWCVIINAMVIIPIVLIVKYLF